MLVNDEYSSWYNRVGDFLLLVWEKKKEFYLAVDQQTGPVRLTTLQNVRPVVLIAIVVECALFISLLNKLMNCTFAIKL